MEGASSLAAILPRTGPAGRRRATRRSTSAISSASRISSSDVWISEGAGSGSALAARAAKAALPPPWPDDEIESGGGVGGGGAVAGPLLGGTGAFVSLKLRSVDKVDARSGEIPDGDCRALLPGNGGGTAWDGPGGALVALLSGVRNDSGGRSSVSDAILTGAFVADAVRGGGGGVCDALAEDGLSGVGGDGADFNPSFTPLVSGALAAAALRPFLELDVLESGVLDGGDGGRLATGSVAFAPVFFFEWSCAIERLILRAHDAALPPRSTLIMTPCLRKPAFGKAPDRMVIRSCCAISCFGPPHVRASHALGQNQDPNLWSQRDKI
jgi:hypothetical protein